MTSSAIETRSGGAAAFDGALLHLDAPELSFRTAFNESSLLFRHRLATHPLFSLERLRRLAKSARGTYFDAGTIGVDQKWKDRSAPKVTIDTAFERIEEIGAWIVIRHAEQDPEYGQLLDELMAGVEEHAGRDLKGLMKSREAIIFVTSPERLTSYHIDRECNFLLQVHGEKEIHVFDQKDPEIVTQGELERFWTVDNDSAIYKKDLEPRARVYNLAPGDGVHIPVNAPHWLKNGGGVSVSLSISFQFPDSHLGDLHRVNYYLRKAGLDPAAPGRFPRRDAWKRRCGPAARAATRMLNLPAYCLYRARLWKQRLARAKAR